MKAEHVLLAFETSGKSGSVAVLHHSDGRLVCDSETLSPDAGSAKTLAPAIECLLAKNGIEIQRLSAIALLTGPGSFTGLRVGVATAKAMAYALQIPTIEIDTLDVIARQCPVASSSFYAVLDAYRGQVFCAKYSVREVSPATQFEKVSQTEIVDIKVLLDRLKEREGETQTIDLCGPGCDRIQKFLAEPESDLLEIASVMAKRIRWIDGPLTVPHAESVGRLGNEKFLAGDVLDPFCLQPRYYRGSAAEELAKDNCTKQDRAANYFQV